MDTKIIEPIRAKINSYEDAVQEYKYATAYYNNWIPHDYSSVLTNNEAYDLLKNDETIREKMNLLSLFASGEKSRLHVSKYVDSREESIYRRVAEKALLNIDRFGEAKKSLIFQSHLFGLSMQEIHWEPKTIRGLPGTWLMPVRLEEYDKRFFRKERNLESKEEYWTMWRKEHDEYIVILDAYEYPGYLGPTTQDFLWCYYEQDNFEPYFRGLSHVLFKLAYTKKFMHQYWHDLAESWSKPWIQVKADMQKGSFNDTDLGSGFETWAARAEEYIKELSKHRAQHILVSDKDDHEIEIHTGGGSIGQNIMSEYIDYADQRIEKNILGESLENKDGGGSFNAGSLKREAMDAVIVDARDAAEETHSNQLLMQVYYRNRKNLWHLGVDVPDKGDVRLEYFIEAEEIKEDYLSEGLSEQRKQRSRTNV